jgi:hypothetical protein
VKVQFVSVGEAPSMHMSAPPSKVAELSLKMQLTSEGEELQAQFIPPPYMPELYENVQSVRSGEEDIVAPSPLTSLWEISQPVIVGEDLSQ